MNGKKRILVVTYYFPPVGGGGTIRVHNFVKYLPEFDVLPVVLTPKEEYIPNLNPSNHLLSEYSPEVEIIRTKLLGPPAGDVQETISGGGERVSFIKKIVAGIFHLVSILLFIPDSGILWYWHSVRKGATLIKEQKLQAVFVTGPPFSSFVIAYRISRKTGTPLILDYRDEWVMNPLYKTRNPLRYWSEYCMEKKITHAADKILVTTQGLKRRLLQHYQGLDAGKVEVLPNGYDPTLYSVSERDIQNSNTIAFTYTGCLSYHRNPGFFLKAMQKFLDKNPEFSGKIIVRFYGFVHEMHGPILNEYIEKGWVEVHPVLPQKDIADILMTETDICLVFIRKEEGGDASIPGKIYEYLATGKPIFCIDDPGGETTNFLKSLNLPLTVKYEDTESIFRALDDLMKNLEKYNEIYALPQEKRERFSRKNLTARLASIIRNSIGEN